MRLQATEDAQARGRRHRHDRAERLCLALIVTALLGGCGSSGPGQRSPLPRADAPHAWPMFRGDPDHRGELADRPTPAWNVKWSVELGERVDASAVIDERNRVIVATRKGLIAAFHVESGEPMGRARLPGGVWSSPALIGDLMLVACDDGFVRAVNLSDLSVRWERRAPSKSFSGITLFEGTAWLTSGRNVIALDPADGTEIVRRGLVASSFTAPAIDARRRLAVVADRAGHVTALSVDNGNRRWLAKTTPGAHNDGSPVIAADRVVLGSNDRHVYAFELDTGTRLWKAGGTDWVVSTAAVYEGAVYIGDDGGVLRALSVTDGQVLWTAQVGDDLASSPTIVGELIVHGAHDSRIHAHRLDGQSLPPIDAGGKIYASVAVSRDGVVVVGTHEGRVVAID